MPGDPKLREFRIVAARYATEQGFPDFLSLALDRTSRGFRLRDLATEMRPLFSHLGWGAYPSRETVGSVVRKWKTPAGELPAPQRIRAARSLRILQDYLTARTPYLNAGGISAQLVVSFSTTPTRPRVEVTPFDV